MSQTMIPFQPIITAGETPFAMLPTLVGQSSGPSLQPNRLVEATDAEIIGSAEARLVMRRAETFKVRPV